MNKKVAIFPGSFDPFTIGHEDIVMRGLKIFDKIIIAIGDNAAKKGFLDIEKRVALIKKCFQGNEGVEVIVYDGLTVDFCLKQGVFTILRGLRTSADFEYERAIGQTNRRLNPKIDTVFILTGAEHTFISSSIVRDILMNGGDASGFLPSHITRADFL